MEWFVIALNNYNLGYNLPISVQAQAVYRCHTTVTYLSWQNLATNKTFHQALFN